MKKKTPEARTIISGRTRFGDIVSEFWMPQKPSHRAVILCDGCPTVPSKYKLGEFFARKGYWVFHMRYRGSWESDGEFLKYPPVTDAHSLLLGLNSGFTEMWTRTKYFLDISDVTVIGSSFGGAVAVLSTLHPLVDRAIALSPVIDLRDEGGESFAEFQRQISEGFGGAYRVPKKNFRKLKTALMYNPVLHAKEIDSKKLFVVHALDDNVVSVGPLRKFAKQTKLKPFLLRTGGHFSTSAIMRPEIWRKVRIFLKN